jgi:hypothetical protein
MDNITDTGLSLQHIQEQFRQWRGRRSSRREPIPAELWEAAVGLCQTYPIARVSRNLGLSYTDLKNRLQGGSVSQAQFMQIDVNCMSSQWHLDCSRPDGGSIRFSGSGRLPDVAGLLRVFLS